MVKIDIISGFLGAGKTTFIKHLLTHFRKTGEKIVLLENEFGQVGIDGDLLKLDGFEVYEIAQGCICCTMKNDFIYTLNEILTKINPDRIIFEPSGIFIPDEVFSIVNSPEFSDKCYINTLFSIVDAQNYLKQKRKYTEFFQKQISYADVVVFSKVQNVSPDVVHEVEVEIRKINNTAPYITTIWNELDFDYIELLLDKDLRSLSEEFLQFKGLDKVHPLGSRCKCHEHAHLENIVSKQEDIASKDTFLQNSHNNHNCECSEYKNNGHTHEKFEAFSIIPSNMCDLASLNKILENLSKEAIGDVVRAKGFVSVKGDTYEFSFVSGSWDIRLHTVSVAPKACFIGTCINKPALKELFES